MDQIKTNKKESNNKMTRAEIQKKQEELQLKNIKNSIAQAKEKEKIIEEKRIDSDDEEDYTKDLEQNINHILREKELEDKERYDKVITATNINEALDNLNINDGDKHPEKRVKAAYTKYVDENLPILKKENPSLKRSQLLEMINKSVVNSFYINSGKKLLKTLSINN